MILQLATKLSVQPVKRRTEEDKSLVALVLLQVHTFEIP